MFRRLLTSSLVMALLLSVIPMPFANQCDRVHRYGSSPIKCHGGPGRGTVRTRLIKQYDDFKSERNQVMDLDDRMSALRYANEAKASETRKNQRNR